MGQQGGNIPNLQPPPNPFAARQARAAARAQNNQRRGLGVIPTQSTIDGVGLDSYGGQKEGLAYEISANRIMRAALHDPATYLDGRIAALEALEAEVSDKFEEKYISYINRGMKPEDAKDKASAWAKLFTEAGLSDIDSQYPANVTETAANLTYKDTSASKIGFK